HRLARLGELGIVLVALQAGGDRLQLAPARVHVGLVGQGRRAEDEAEQQERAQQEGGPVHGRSGRGWGGYVSTGRAAHGRPCFHRAGTMLAAGSLAADDMAQRQHDRQDPAAPTIWTVGHSTLEWEAFLELLRAHGIGAIADVRRYPGSRRYPWFASDALARALPQAGIGYRWLPQLGGRRAPRPDSLNTAWRNAGFRGYADLMASTEFGEGLAAALELAATQRTALMCAEAVWWRCHRRLLSDLLQHRGWQVLHILDAGPAQPHPGNPDARPAGDGLVYPALQGGLFPEG